MSSVKKKIFILFIYSIFTGCVKKYDWVCTCEIYTPTQDTIRTKEINHKAKNDADSECAKFGEEAAGANGAHDCSTKVK